MSVFASFLVLISSFSWSLFDLSRKQLSHRYDPLRLVIFLMGFHVLLFSIVTSFEGAGSLNLDYAQVAFLAILLNAIAQVSFIFSVKWAPLSLSVPMLSLTPVFSSLGSKLFLGEDLFTKQWIGIVFVVVGTLLLRLRGLSSVQIHDQKQAKKGILLMVLVSLCWSLTPVMDKYCLQYTSGSHHALIQSGGVGLLIIAWLLFQKRSPFLSIRDATQKEYRWVLLMAVVSSAAAILTQLWAIEVIYVGLFEAMKRALSLFFSLYFGYKFFSEALSAEKYLSILAMAVGLSLILV